MPPTSIDGTDITGATIDGTDVTEITVDGQTVFTAGPDLPDSAVRQWAFAERTTSGTGVITETLANDDGDTTGGPTNTADNSFFDGFYEATDGVDDAILLPVSEFQSQLQSKDVGIAFTVRTTDVDDVDHMLGSLDGDASDRIQIFQDSEPDWIFEIRASGSENSLRVPNSQISDGTIRRIFWQINTDDANNWAVFVNDSDTNANLNANNLNDLSTLDLNGNRVAFGAREFGGSLSTFHNGDWDNVILYDAPSRQDITDDYQLQPWS